MFAAVDFGLTNIDIAVRNSDTVAYRFATTPSASLVDVSQLERAIACVGHRPEEFARIGVTGGQHRKLPDSIGNTPIVKVNEITAIGLGGLRLAAKEQALVVSAGSGTAIVAARGSQIQHVTGSAVGGGTLQGLGRLLLGTSDALEINALAERGNSNVPDLTLIEATGGALGRLPSDANAVNFGRFARPNTSARREDIAAALVVMVSQVIAVIAINAARAEQLIDIVIVGHLVDLPTVRNVLHTVAGYYGASFTIPAQPGFATALGALEKTLEQ
ncbi:MAG: Fumble domain-containing protein [Candidatus Roseilinea sp.]|uniref:Fumble domain-containing protein n=1 Tax=Candidatus Roseilinea sp. TaxID=2838777 RepID=UPI004049C8A9